MNTNVLLSSLLAPAVVLTASAELTEIDTKIVTFQNELLSAMRLLTSLTPENADAIAIKLEKITAKLEILAPQISAEDYENLSEEGWVAYERNVEILRGILFRFQSGMDEKVFQRLLKNNPRLYSALMRLNELNEQFSNRVNQNRRETLEYLYADEIENLSTEDKLILEGQKICLTVLTLLSVVNEENAEEVAETMVKLIDRYEQIGAQVQPDDINKMGEIAWTIYRKSMRDGIIATARFRQNESTYMRAIQKSPALLQASLRWAQLSPKINEKIYGNMNDERRAQRDRELQKVLRSMND